MRDFYERAGYRVATTAGADWYVPGQRVCKSFPCGKAVAPAAEEVAELCRRKAIVGVEFCSARGIGVRTSNSGRGRQPARSGERRRA
jgi:hypothetical protein